MTHRITLILAALSAFSLQAFSLSPSAAPAPALHTIDLKSTADLREFFRYSPEKDIFISGHRGGILPGYPENSIEACEKTLSLLPAYFEIDPRYTKDGVLVLMHDATIDRTTTGKGKVSDYTYAELQKFFLKDRQGNVTPYKIPTLDEMLEWGAGKTLFQIDHKDVPPQVISDNLKGKWSKYHNLILATYTAKSAAFYNERNDNVMFLCSIPTMKQYEEFRAAGIPWDRIIAFVGKTMNPEQQELYALLRGHGAKIMIAIAPGADKITPDSARIEAYKQEIARGPDIIETDHPASFADLPRARQTLHTINLKSMADLQEFFRYAPGKDIVIRAHRGGTWPGYPENSIAAFEKTLSLLPAYFEIDPRVTKDGVLVLMHDATIDRTTTGKGKVSDYTCAELQKFFLKDRQGNVTPYKIPTLDEVLEWGADKTLFQFDHKDVPPQVIADNLKGKWAKYHNIVLATYTPANTKSYYERNRDNSVMFACRIPTMEVYEQFRATGVPWNRIIATVGTTIKPEQQALCDLLRGHGVKITIAIAPGADKIKPDSARIEAYKQELARNPDIIETDHPAAFADLLRARADSK